MKKLVINALNIASKSCQFRQKIILLPNFENKAYMFFYSSSPIEKGRNDISITFQQQRLNSLQNGNVKNVLLLHFARPMNFTPNPQTLIPHTAPCHPPPSQNGLFEKQDLLPDWSRPIFKATLNSFSMGGQPKKTHYSI